MTTLLVYYSRTGTTKKVAEKISSILKCENLEIIAERDRKGIAGYIISGKEAIAKKITAIKKIEKNLSDFELIIIGTPIWGGNISSPIRTVLEEYKNKFKKIAFFATQGGNGAERAFSEMEKITGLKPLSTMTLTTKEVINDIIEDKIKNFINNL